MLLSSTGGAAEHQGSSLGEFVKAGEQSSAISVHSLSLFYSTKHVKEGEHGGNPYFHQRDTVGDTETYLFYNGTDWIVGPVLGEGNGKLLNRQNTESPPTDQWQFWDEDNSWKKNDTSLALQYTTLPATCQTIRVAGEGAVVEKQGKSLGDYRLVIFLVRFPISMKTN